jgi:hypothetical protein
MAKPAKKKTTDTPAKKTVKVSSGVKPLAPRDIPRYISDKRTKPLNTVLVNGDTIEGLTEEEKVAEGIFPPLQRAPSWEKSEEDKAKLYGPLDPITGRRKPGGIHTGKRGPRGGTGGNRNRGFKSTLILHRFNVDRKKDFATTLSFICYPDEVNGIKNRHHDPEQRKLVTKYHYRGETTIV